MMTASRTRSRAAARLPGLRRRWPGGGAVRVHYGYDIRGLTIADLAAIYQSIVVRD